MTRRLYIAKAPPFSPWPFEAHVADIEIPKIVKGGLAQILKAKCRELARSDSGLLVSPTVEALNSCYGAVPKLSLWIVSKAGYLRNTKTNTRLNQLEIKVNRQVAFNHNILQTCYHFTLVARLAPKWNKVTNWLLQGSEFLTEGKAPAIDLQIGLTTNDITLSLSVYKLSLSHMKVEDLLTTSTILHSFRRDPRSVIQEGSIYNNRCLLLPNFTTGYIYSASHYLPPGEEFQTYDQVRLHWKKQHGIILPERQELFYQVFFRGNAGKRFSYPGSCVYKSKPIPYPSKDTEIVATSFIADVHARLPAMCGEQVRYSNSALAPSVSLQQATGFNTHHASLSYPNLKRLPISSSNFTSLPRPSQSQPKTSFSVSSQIVPSVVPRVDSDRQVNKTVNSARVVPIFKTKTVTPHFTNAVAAPQAKLQPPIVPRFKSALPGASQTLGKRSADNSTLRDITKSTVPGPKRLCTNTGTTRTSTTHHLSKQASTLQGGQQRVTTPVSQAPSSCNQTVPDMNAFISSQLDDFDVSMNTISSDKHVNATPHGKMDTAKAQGKRKQSATAGLTCEYDLTGVEADILKKIAKAKAAVLKKWLGENGVKCRSKEKKDDLVKMVAQHIKSTGKSLQSVLHVL